MKLKTLILVVSALFAILTADFNAAAAVMLLVGSANGSSVQRFDGTSGAFIDNFTSGGGPVSGQSCPVYGPNGNLYVKEWSYAGGVREYDGVTGVFINTVVPVISDAESAILFGPDGKLYAEGPSRGEINRYDGATGALVGTFVPAGSG